MASALKAAGLGVRLWTGGEAEQAAARNEGLDARNARLGVDIATREAELEEIADALLLTDDDNFNALAAFELRQELGHDHVYRLSPHGPLLDLVPRYAEGRILFTRDLTFPVLTRQFDSGAHLFAAPADDGTDTRSAVFGRRQLLFIISAKGRLRVASAGERLEPTTGDSAIWLIENREVVDDDGRGRGERVGPRPQALLARAIAQRGEGLVARPRPSACGSSTLGSSGTRYRMPIATRSATNRWMVDDVREGNASPLTSVAGRGCLFQSAGHRVRAGK